jgi:hypothetical protein
LDALKNKAACTQKIFAAETGTKRETQVEMLRAFRKAKRRDSFGSTSSTSSSSESSSSSSESSRYHRRKKKKKAEKKTDDKKKKWKKRRHVKKAERTTEMKSKKQEDHISSDQFFKFLSNYNEARMGSQDASTVPKADTPTSHTIEE